MRVLFSSPWQVGHVFPMVPLARALVESGHDVRWATNEAGCDLVRAGGFEVVAVAPLVAAVMDRPCVTHAFGGALPAEVVGSPSEAVAAMWAEQGLETPAYSGLFAAGYLDICPASVQGVAVDHINRRIPLRPGRYSGEPTGALPAIVTSGDDRPLVYLTLGTVVHNNDVMASTLAALAEHDVRVLVTVGNHGDPDALGPQPSNVDVRQWVCQSEVLPYCDLVVSHGGSGTFLAALSYGLPQLCLPHQADQFRNAHSGAARGVAAFLRPDQATDDGLAKALSVVLGDDSYRRASGEVAREIRDMPDPKSVVTTLTDIASRG